MLSNILKNLVHKPATREFPKVRREPIADVRGSLGFEEKNCTYCSACMLKCPANAIKVDRQAKTFEFTVVKCVLCGVCVEACKKDCIQMHAQVRSPSYTKPTVEFQGAPIISTEETK